MAADWEGEMQDKFDRLQRALTDELRTQLTAMGAQLEERLEQRLGARLDTRLEASETRLAGRIDARLEASEARLAARIDTRLAEADERLSHRLRVQTEELREIVRTAADNYGGVLDSIHRDLADLRQGCQTKSADTDRVLAEHVGRIVALERATGMVRD